jgi:RNA recognition motif-containing protein
MSKRIYVGNLPFSASSEDVQQLFEEFGSVTEVHLVTDRQTGQPRGFGFVEMSDDQAAVTAIGALNDKEFMGRNLKVNEARPRENRGGGGRGGGYGGGGGGGYGGGSNRW